MVVRRNVKVEAGDARIEAARVQVAEIAAHRRRQCTVEVALSNRVPVPVRSCGKLRCLAGETLNAVVVWIESLVRRMCQQAERLSGLAVRRAVLGNPDQRRGIVPRPPFDR